MTMPRTDILDYKGYVGSIDSDMEAGLLHGTVHGINDVIHYEAQTLHGLEQAFRESVDDYLAFCEASGDKPERPYSGKFQARVGSELHRRAASVAAARSISLNDLVKQALEQVVAAHEHRAGRIGFGSTGSDAAQG